MRTAVQLQVAEADARTAAEWLDCARDWDLLGDAAAARRCLERSAQQAVSCADWLGCAGIARRLGWEAGTLRFLDRAEALAGTVEESLECAHRRRRLDDGGGMRRNLSQAGTRAADVASWLRLAEAWRSFDIGKAVQCLGEARARATRVDEWLSIAVFQDESDWLFARKTAEATEAELGQAIGDCVSRAEQLARDSRDWLACAGAWEKLGRNEGTNPLFHLVRANNGSGYAAVRRCIVAAEAHARDGIELENCMRAWLNLLSDEAEAERCRALAGKHRLP
jgi:hypothetical protein